MVKASNFVFWKKFKKKIITFKVWIFKTLDNDEGIHKHVIQVKWEFFYCFCFIFPIHVFAWDGQHLLIKLYKFDFLVLHRNLLHERLLVYNNEITFSSFLRGKCWFVLTLTLNGTLTLN